MNHGLEPILILGRRVEELRAGGVGVGALHDEVNGRIATDTACSLLGRDDVALECGSGRRRRCMLTVFMRKEQRKANARDYENTRDLPLGAHAVLTEPDLPTHPDRLEQLTSERAGACVRLAAQDPLAIGRRSLLSRLDVAKVPRGPVQLTSERLASCHDVTLPLPLATGPSADVGSRSWGVFADTLSVSPGLARRAQEGKAGEAGPQFFPGGQIPGRRWWGGKTRPSRPWT
jgi:hypothetical protein